ncbi:MAG: hypothetical protein F4Z66_08370 [Gammaproteobacteria bacterium]|nr:hypothetical protein [Gammaproteobacteria bacterium]
MTKHLALTISTCLVVLMSTNAWSESPKLTGTWTLDEELTKELQPPIKKNRRAGQGLRGYIGGGGILTPLPGGGSSPASGAAGLKVPLILDCSELTLEASEDKITVSCVNGMEREFNVGKVHGRTTKWKKTRLTEFYRSTSRSVRHLIKLDREGNMIATVTLQPKGGVSQKYVRAFNRKPAISEEASKDKEPTPNSS